MYRLLTYFTVVTIVSGSEIIQSWIAPDSVIPLKEIKKDCDNSLPFTVSVEIKPPSLPTSCDLSKSNISMYEFLLKRRISDCYNNTRCTYILWSKSHLGFGCTVPEHEQELRNQSVMIVKTTCRIPGDLTVYALTSNSKFINASKPICSNDGRKQRIKHMFTISHCPKQMLQTEDALREIRRLQYDMEQCGGSCLLIDTSLYRLQKWSCPSDNTEVENVGIGVYWTCHPAYTSITSPPPTTTTTGKEGYETVTDKEQLAHHKKMMDKTVLRYQVALIVVTLLLVVCLVLLIAVIYYYRCYKASNKRGFTGSRPPSRRTLYDRANSVASNRSRQSDRYVANRQNTADRQNAQNTKAANLDEEYAVPMIDDRPYENADEDTYEMIDVDTMKYSQPSTSVERKSTYVSMNKQRPPQRENSEKYSYGYLLPNELRKSKR